MKNDEKVVTEEHEAAAKKPRLDSQSLSFSSTFDMEKFLDKLHAKDSMSWNPRLKLRHNGTVPSNLAVFFLYKKVGENLCTEKERCWYSYELFGE